MKHLKSILFLILFSANILSLYAQDVSVAGQVKDAATGEPLIGVSVIVVGTSVGTATDIDGRYRIMVSDMVNGELKFSYIGYKTLSVKMNSRTNLDVAMTDEANILDGVVVVAYAKQKKETVTGAVSSIGTKDLVQSPQANISNALAGRLPGLLAVQRSGLPGEDASTLRIRGTSSFAKKPDGFDGADPQAPLVMVDGIESDNFNNIDPSEIATFTILKDASSTAVYGVRGANGVILITTHRGATGKPKISVSTNFAVTNFPYMRESMNSYEYATYYNIARAHDAYVQGINYEPKYTDDMIAKFRDHSDPIFYPDTDWFDTMLRDNSYQTRTNLNVSGGTERVKYFVSLGYFTQEGLFNTEIYDPGYDFQAKYKRYNLRSNLDIDVTKNLSASFDLSAQIGDFHGINWNVGGMMASLSSTLPMAAPGVIDNKIVNIPATNGANPLDAFNKGWNTRNENTLNGSVRLNYKMDYLLKGLALRGAISFKNFYSDNKTYNKQGSTYQAYVNDAGETVFLVPEGNDPLSIGWNLNSKNQRIYLEGGIEYTKSIADHNFTGLLLYNQSKYYSPSLKFNIPQGIQGLVGRVTYNYKNRYLAEYNIGYNGTENFAVGKRFGFFPAYSLGWVVSEESFFPDNEWFSFLKIRGSYGTVGNDKLGGDAIRERFLYLPSSFVYEGNAYYFGPQAAMQSGSLDDWSPKNGTQGSIESKLGNADLTWEKAIKKNIGVDAYFLNSKINLVLDYFSESRSNILANRSTLPQNILGVTLPAYNIGEMENSGWDGEITYNDNIGNVSYFLKANYTYAHNEINYMDELFNYTYYHQTGHRDGQFFGLVADGFYNSWEEVNDPNRPDYTQLGTNLLQPGDLRYVDINSDGVIDNNDIIPIGYSNFPEVMFGFSFGGSWKGFDLSILFQGADRVSTSPSRSIKTGFWDDTGANKQLIESWSQERYEQGLPITFPRLAANYGTINYPTSTFWIENARYLRLKNAEIGYTIKSSWLQKSGISSIRVYTNGSNLLTWSNLFEGEDPEFPTGGNEDPYPVTRIFNFGLNVNF